MKTCIECLIEKTLDQFNNWKKSKDNKNPRCRICQNEQARKRYAAKPNRKRGLRDWDNKRRNEIKNYIRSIKLQNSCIDCGNSDFRVLEFDHLSDKKYNISQLPSKGVAIQLVKDEIAKCELVCANCHRIRTYERRINGEHEGI